MYDAQIEGAPILFSFIKDLRKKSGNNNFNCVYLFILSFTYSIFIATSYELLKYIFFIIYLGNCKIINAIMY